MTGDYCELCGLGPLRSSAVTRIEHYATNGGKRRGWLITCAECAIAVARRLGHRG